VTAPQRQPGPSSQALHRLRVRLTAWYVGTFAVILVLLGAGMFATITRRYDSELDESLRVSASELVRVVRQRGRAAEARLFDSADFRIPDRTQYVTDRAGKPIAGPMMAEWLADLARRASRHGPLQHTHPEEVAGSSESRVIRAYALPFSLPTGDSLVAIATADEIEIEDRYASLIVTFGIAALVAVLLVAMGGGLLARQSTAPVEKSIQHMRRFMADAAHELRTPLTVLRSRAEVTLQRSREPDEYILALNAIERESVRLGQIVEDLLMLARADAGERPIERRRVLLDDIALDATETVRIIAERRPVRLELEGFEEAPVEGDASLLRQLLIILLDNALKYTPPRGLVRVAVTSDATSVTLTVSDTGIGIAGEHLPLVFDRFYRADPARSRADQAAASSSQGVGLGLAIARWITEQHSARITIESQPDRGTAVSVVFPRAPVPA
jgi:signal transduction histidine kinase